VRSSNSPIHLAHPIQAHFEIVNIDLELLGDIRHRFFGAQLAQIAIVLFADAVEEVLQIEPLLRERDEKLVLVFLAALPEGPELFDALFELDEPARDLAVFNSLAFQIRFEGRQRLLSCDEGSFRRQQFRGDVIAVLLDRADLGLGALQLLRELFRMRDSVASASSRSKAALTSTIRPWLSVRAASCSVRSRVQRSTSAPSVSMLVPSEAKLSTRCCASSATA
jgi:hypothetical protein